MQVVGMIGVRAMGPGACRRNPFVHKGLRRNAKKAYLRELHPPSFHTLISGLQPLDFEPGQLRVPLGSRQEKNPTFLWGSPRLPELHAQQQ